MEHVERVETGVVACGLSGGVDNLCYLVTSRFKFLEEYIMRCTIIIRDTQRRLHRKRVRV